ncbi:MAG: PAS domain-containing protein [Paracoccaceae bacterium]
MDINGSVREKIKSLGATLYGGNVVAMSRFQQDNRFAAVQEVAAYWEALRAGRLMPNRSEIDPRGIEGALEYAFILERIAPGIARMRVAGSHLLDLMGMEVRGMPVTSFFTPVGRNALNSIMEDVFEQPAVADLTLIGERAVGKPPLDARMILLPVKSDLGDTSRILGCLVAKGEIGRHPRRFEIVSTKLRRLGDGLDQLVPSRSQDLSDRQPIAGFAEPKTEMKRKAAPHLRLVKGDE